MTLRRALLTGTRHGKSRKLIQSNGPVRVFCFSFSFFLFPFFSLIDIHGQALTYGFVGTIIGVELVPLFLLATAGACAGANED
jgi:hypothetical protein